MTLPEIDRILGTLCSHECTWREVHPEVHSLINELQDIRAKREAVIERRLRSCAATLGDALDAKTLAATIDGMKVKDLASFRAQPRYTALLSLKGTYLERIRGRAFRYLMDIV